MKIAIMASYTFLNYKKHYKISNKIFLDAATGESWGADIYLHVYQKSVHIPLPTVQLLRL